MSANKSKELAVKIMRLTGGYPCEESELQKSLESLLDEALREAFEAGEKKNFSEMAQSCELHQKDVRLSQIARDAEVAEKWRCNDEDNKCYPCDCGGEVPQDAIAKAIREQGNL